MAPEQNTMTEQRRPERAIESLEPKAPHDALGFEDLAKSYNFRNTSNIRHVFARMINDECDRRSGSVRVLDIGCGRGLGREVGYQWAMRPHIDEYWGIEPDPSIKPEAGLYEHFQHALMEDADLPEAGFDVAYSFMVMEHVADPRAYLQAVRRCLKPGGVHFFITPNARHFVTRCAIFLHKIGLDEIVLKLIKRGEEGEYHYPVKYLFNREQDIDRHARDNGFEPPGYVYLETEVPRGYLKGPFSLVIPFLEWKRRTFRNPRSLVTLICRMEKGPE